MSTEEFDVLILGSGMAGLSSGLILAKEGYRVCIVEKEAQIGGTLQCFKRDGIKFDTGVHYIGSLEPGQPLYPYFKYLDIFKDLDLLKLDDDGYDRISFGDPKTIYPHAQGYDNFQARLVERFPNEEEGIVKYIKGIRDLCDKFELYNLDKNLDAVNELEYMEIGAKEFIESCTSDPLLQDVLAGSNLLYAGDERTPLYVHALVINSYILSSYKVKNGGQAIARSLNYSLRDQGAKIIRNAEVTSINIEDKKVKSVTLKNGKTIGAKTFISNIHPANTLKLIDQSELRKSYVSRIMSLENTISVFTLYVVLKPGTVKYKNYNLYHFHRPNVWEATDYQTEKWGKDFALYQTPSDDHPGYASALVAMAYTRYEETEAWTDTQNTTLNQTARGEAYEKFKEEKAQILFDELEQYISDVRSKTESYFTSTPLTQRDYLNTVDGSLYGIIRDHNSPLKSMINSKTKFSNLYFTGQNIILHGILGATISAVSTCGHILGKEYLMNKLRPYLK